MDLAALQSFVKVGADRQLHARGRRAVHAEERAAVAGGPGQLERSCRCACLRRSTRSLSLTEAGRRFFERAQGHPDFGGRCAASHATHPRRAARARCALTCGVEFGLVAVSAWIAEYLLVYPQVQVEADYQPCRRYRSRGLRPGGAASGRLSDSSLAARRLGMLDYLVMRVAQLLAAPRPTSQPEGTGHAPAGGVGAGAAPQRQWHLTRGDDTERLKLQPRLSVNTSLAAKEALQRGLGIGLLPRVAEPAGQPALRRVLPDWAMPEVPVHAVFASARYLTRWCLH